jgi:YggT family protein
MFILGNFIKAVAVIFGMALDIYMWIIIIRALISWVSPDPYNPIVIFLHRATEPVMSRVRRYLPIGGLGGIDISPIVIILLIVFLRILIVDSLLRLSIILIQ